MGSERGSCLWTYEYGPINLIYMTNFNGMSKNQQRTLGLICRYLMLNDKF